MIVKLLDKITDIGKYGHYKSRLDDFYCGFRPIRDYLTLQWGPEYLASVERRPVLTINKLQPFLDTLEKYDVKVRDISDRQRKRRIKKNLELLNLMLYGTKNSRLIIP